MKQPKRIHLGTTSFAGKGPGTYTGGVAKIAKNYADDVLSSSKQFWETARFCLNDGEIEPGKKTLLVPGVVCAAFSCELSLKWLIHRNSGNETKGHLLTKLFEELNSSDKTAISGFSQDFDDFLKRNKNLFVDARYHHEKSLFAFREQEILEFAGYLIRHIGKLHLEKDAQQ